MKYASADGCFLENDGASKCLLQAEEDITITDISLGEDPRSVSDIQIVIANQRPEFDGQDTIVQEVVADYLWDGKSPVELAQGQYIFLNFTFCDPNLANVPCGYTQYHLTVQYQDKNGDTFCKRMWFPMSVQTVEADPHELYLAHQMGIDVMRYYTDYYYALAEYGIVTGNGAN